MRILFSSSKTKTVKAQGMYVGVGSFIQHHDHTHNSSTAPLLETGYSTKCCCFVVLNPFTFYIIIYTHQSFKKSGGSLKENYTYDLKIKHFRMAMSLHE